MFSIIDMLYSFCGFFTLGFGLSAKLQTKGLRCRVAGKRIYLELLH